jgi:hypothetical protein
VPVLRHCARAFAGLVRRGGPAHGAAVSPMLWHDQSVADLSGVVEIDKAPASSGAAAGQPSPVAGKTSEEPKGVYYVSLS